MVCVGSYAGHSKGKAGNCTYWLRAAIEQLPLGVFSCECRIATQACDGMLIVAISSMTIRHIVGQQAVCMDVDGIIMGAVLRNVNVGFCFVRGFLLPYRVLLVSSMLLTPLMPFVASTTRTVLMLESGCFCYVFTQSQWISCWSYLHFHTGGS